MIDGYLRLYFLFQPNFLEVFFWTAIGYCVIRYIATGRAAWLYGFGISIGLGMMSKYSVAFYTVSVIAGLLISRHRKVFRNPHFYYALALALLIFLPNLIWQYAHNFPVVFHMKELQEEQLQYIQPFDFIFSQFMMNLPCVYIWVAGLCFVLFSGAGKAYRALGWAWVGVIVLLIVLHGKDYYALGAYPVLFAFGGVYLEQLTTRSLTASPQARSWKWIRYVLVTASLALGLFGLPLTMPLAAPATLVRYYHATGLDNKTGFKWEDRQFHPRPQDFADMIGWREMAEKAAAVYHSLSAGERDSTIIVCRGYFSAGALTYYAKETGLPEIYSGNASFLFWLPDHFAGGRTPCRVRNILLVGHHLPDKDEAVFQQFGKMTIKDSLVMPLFRENGMRFMLFEQGSDSLCAVIDRTVAAEKKQFMRQD